MEPTSPHTALLVLDLANVGWGFSTHAPKDADGRPAQLDLVRFRSCLESLTRSKVSEAVAFTHTDEGRGAFLGLMRNAGYNLVTRPLRTFTDEHGGVRKVCNMDAEMAAEAVLRSVDHDAIIIASGDGDFVPLVGSLRAAGKKVFAASHPRSMSGDLMAAVGREHFLDLGTYHRALRMKEGQSQVLPGPPPPRVMVHPELGDAPASGKAALIVDGQFLSSSCRREGWQPDYRRLAQLAAARFGPLASATLVDRDHVSRLPFQDAVRRIGWTVVTKREKRDHSCSTAVELSCAAIEAARAGHSIVLCAGSGHLRHLVHRLRENECEVGLAAPVEGLSHSLRATFSDEAFLNVSAHRGALSLGHASRAYSAPALRRIPTPAPAQRQHMPSR